MCLNCPQIAFFITYNEKVMFFCATTVLHRNIRLSCNRMPQRKMYGILLYFLIKKNLIKFMHYICNSPEILVCMKWYQWWTMYIDTTEMYVTMIWLGFYRETMHEFILRIFTWFIIILLKQRILFKNWLVAILIYIWTPFLLLILLLHSY